MSLANILAESLSESTNRHVDTSIVDGEPVGDGDLDLTEEIAEIDFAHLVEATNGKVSTFLTVFSSILTQYDQLLSRNEMKRGRVNIYRLGHYLDALDRVRADVQGVLNDDSKEAVAKLRAATVKRFFPNENPGRKMVKVIDDYLDGGKLPKIPISKEVKAQIAAEKRAAKAAKTTKSADMPMAAEADAWIDGLDGVELSERGRYNRRRAYSNDPRWIEEGMPYAEDIHDDPRDDLLGEEDGHYFRDGSAIYVDTAFINAAKNALKGYEIQHLGMGEFALKGPDGEIEFDRMRGKSFPGMSGRSHKLYGPAELIKKLLAAMKGKAKEVTESTIYEAQRGPAALAFPDEDVPTKPGAFKISSKAMKAFKDGLGDQWEGPESALFKRQRDLVMGLSRDDLMQLFGADSIDKAQDIIAGKPKAAFNKWLMMASKVSPKLGSLVRSQPDNAALLFYLTMVRVVGRDLADITLKRYFETESDHIGAVKARVKVEELERVLGEALGPPNVGWMENMVNQVGEIGRTMANRISHHKKGGGDEAWLRGALLEEVRRMEQTMKLLRRRLDT